MVKVTKKLAIAVVVVIAILMIITSFSGAFYYNSPTNPSQGSHVYLVTTSVGGQNYSYYEEVKNGKVLKTWPAPSSPQTGTSGLTVPTNSSYTLGSSSLPSERLKGFSPEHSSASFNSPGFQNAATSGNDPSQSDFNITATYSVSSVTISPLSETVPQGQSLKFTGTWEGGLAPYKYSWEAILKGSNKANIFQNGSTSGTSINLVLDASSITKAKSLMVELSVSGSGPGSPVNATAQVEISDQGNSNLMEATLSPSTSVIIVGQPLVLTGNWYEGGVSQYQYAFVLSSSANPTGNDNQWPVSYNATFQTSAQFTFNPIYGTYGIYYLYLFVIFHQSKNGNQAHQQDDDQNLNPLVARAEIIVLPGMPAVSAVTISPSWIYAYKGEPITLTGTWTGGTAPYEYAWIVNGSAYQSASNISQPVLGNTTSGSSATYSFTPNSPGVYSVSLFVNGVGSGGTVSAEANVLVQNSAGFNIENITISPTTTNAYVGEPIAFNAIWNGGTAPYHYFWRVSTTFPDWAPGFSGDFQKGKTNNSSSQFTFDSSQYGIFYLYLFVWNSDNGDSDSNSFLAASSKIIVLHQPNPLTSSAISISPTTTKVGDPVSVSIEPGYGTSPFTYTWSVSLSSGGSASGDYSTLNNTIIFNIGGTYSVTVTVEDANGVKASITATITVSSALHISISGPSFIDSGQSATLGAQINGGVPPYTGQWLVRAPSTSTYSDLGGPFSMGSTATVNTGVLTTTGTWSFKLSAEDNAGDSAISLPVNITVNPALKTLLSSTSGNALDVGYSLVFTNTTSGGTPPLSYSYSVSPSSGWTQSSNPGNTFTFTSVGSYNVVLTVKDATGTIVTSSIQITVNQLPAIAIQPQSYSIDPGQNFAPLSSTVQYGTGPYTWKWYSGASSNGVLVASGVGSTASFLPTGSGSYYVIFSDQNGAYVKSSVATVTVNVAPNVSISPSSAKIDASQSINLVATVTGGSGSFSYSWTIGGSSDIVGSQSTYSFSQSTPGTYVVWLNVTDSGTYSPYAFSPLSVSIVVIQGITVSISPSSAEIDASQSINLVATVTGGSGSFSYSWQIGSNVVGTSSTYLFSESVTGTYSVTLNVTDEETYSPYYVTSTVLVVVNPAPSIITQPVSAIIDSGQSISLSSTVNGGTGSFSWKWFDSSGPIPDASGNGTVATHTFTTSDSGVYVKFTDTGITSGATPIASASSSQVSITVDPALAISVQPSNAVIDLGQSITLSSSVSGGTGKFSWSLYTSTGVVVATGTGANALYTVSPLQSSSYSFTFTDTGVTSAATPAASIASNQASITVKPALLVGINPSSATISIDQTMLFSASVSGGTGSYSYFWSIGGNSTVVSTTSTYSFEESTTGTYVLYLNVTDTGTNPSYTLSTSASISVKVGSMSVTFASDVPLTGSGALDGGQKIILGITPTIAGGVSPYNYQWFLNGTASKNKIGSPGIASSGNEINYQFSPAGMGTYTFYLEILSADGQNSISSPITITVYASLSMQKQPSSTVIDLGQQVTLSSIVSGGTGTFTWTLYSSSGTPVSTGTGSTASYTFSPLSTGSYYFVFTDTGVTQGATPSSSSVLKSASASVTVNPDPVVTVQSVSISAGSSVTLTATASGGSGVGYAFKWYSNSQLTTLIYSGNPFKTPQLTTTTTYYVTVTDSTGMVSVPAPVTVTVVNGLSSSVLSISPSATDVGYNVSVSVEPAYGLAPFTYSWKVTLFPSGSATGSYSSSGNHVTFTVAGTYSVTATVKDSSGATASITATITINALPKVSVSPSSPAIDVNSTVTFSNSTSGGTSPISFKWVYPANAGITRSGNQFTFNKTGNFTIYLYANDSVGASSHSVSTVSVNSQPVIIYSSLTVTISGPAAVDNGTAANILITSVTGTSPYKAQLQAEFPGSTKYSIIASLSEFNDTPASISTGILTTLGTWHFVVQVTEYNNAAKFGTSSPVTVTVVNPPTSSALTISPVVTDVGSPVTVSIQSGYGIAPFVYAWTVTLSSGGSAAGNYSFSGNTITFKLPGSYSVTATVEDSDGMSASVVAQVKVNPQLAITLSATTPTSIDKGQTVTFSYSINGGTAPYSVSYTVMLQGGALAFGAFSVSGNIITFTAVGNYTVDSIVTDALSSTSTSNVLNVKVSALPTITISPSSTTIDTNHSVTFTNNTTGGTAPFVFIWSYQSNSGISQSGNVFTFSKVGNFTITLTIVDAVGATSSSSSIITVNPSPVIILQPGHANTQNSSVSALSSSNSPLAFQQQKKTFGAGSDPTITLDENTPWTVLVQQGTGTPPYSFTWTVKYLSNGTVATDYILSSSNSSYSNNVIDFKGIGNYSVQIKVVDAFGSTSSENVTVQVNSPLLVVHATVQGTPSSFDLGNSTTLTSTPTISGGTPPYSFQWYRNGTNSTDKISGASGSITSGQALTLPQTPAVAGTYTFYLVITDNAFSPASNSTGVIIQVNMVPVTSALMISPTSTVVDGLINATIKPGYGTAPFTYVWAVKLLNGSSAAGDYNSTGNQIGFNKPGNYSVSLMIKDADGKIAYNNTTVRIYSSSLVVVTITSPSSVPTIDAGQSQSISASFSGGSGSYEYEWVIQSNSTPLPPGSGYTSGSSPESYSFSSASPGTFYVFLYVKDTIVGDTGHAYREVKVNNDLAQSSISISPASTSVGSPVTATVVSGYGTPPFTYVWSITLSSGGSATGDFNISGNQVTFSKGGNYTVKVTVSDSYSSATSSPFAISVSAVVSLTVYISSYPTSGITATDAGHSQTFQANVFGGSGSYSYAWGISGIPGTVGTGSTYTFNESTPGLYLIWLNVTQGSSRATAQPLTIIVNPLPKTSFPGGSTIQTDAGETISAYVTGGTPPYKYSWLVAMYPSGGSAVGDYQISGNSISFSVKGNYTVEFIVTDYVGAIASATVTVLVNYQLSSSISLTNPLSSVIDRGNSSILSASVSGGSGDFAYQWYEQPAGSTSFSFIPGATNRSYIFVTTPATLPGIYLFYVNVTDLGTDPASINSNIISVTVLANVVYKVTISQIGLPLGTTWYANITGGKSYSSSTSNISFLESNGSYSISISTGNNLYRPSQSSGLISLTVNGAQVSQSIVFLKVVYPVTFTEYGLKSGTEWYVNLTNGQSFSSTLAVISFSEQNGTFGFSIASLNRSYFYSNGAGSFSVQGSPVSVSVRFALFNSSVTFQESGLPTGIRWFVYLTNGQSFNTSSSSVAFNEPNGTYHYFVSTSDKIYYSNGGTFVVKGTSVLLRLSFSFYYYNISFVETGLSAGVPWTVTFGNITKSSLSSIYFEAVNGTYSFAITPISGYTTEAYDGTIVVDGSSFTETVTWKVVTYPVTIVETGLPDGATWSVTLTTTTAGGQQSVVFLTSTSDSITFNVTNGSYSYVVNLPKGYQVTPYKSQISVVGAAVTTTLKISPIPNYPLIFIIAAISAIILVLLVFNVRKNSRSVFEREERFIERKRRKNAE